jgi:hypothetical protein
MTNLIIDIIIIPQNSPLVNDFDIKMHYVIFNRKTCDHIYGHRLYCYSEITQIMIEVLFRLIRFISQQVAYAAIQIVTDSGKHRQVHTGDLIAAITVELCSTDITVLDNTVFTDAVLNSVIFKCNNDSTHTYNTSLIILYIISQKCVSSYIF